MTKMPSSCAERMASSNWVVLTRVKPTAAGLAAMASSWYCSVATSSCFGGPTHCVSQPASAPNCSRPARTGTKNGLSSWVTKMTLLFPSCRRGAARLLGAKGRPAAAPIPSAPPRVKTSRRESVIATPPVLSTSVPLACLRRAGYPRSGWRLGGEGLAPMSQLCPVSPPLRALSLRSRLQPLPAAHRHVEQHRQDDDRPFGDRLAVLLGTEQHQTGRDHAGDRRPEERAEDTADAAEQVRAADDHRRDDVELVSRSVPA